MKYEFDEQTKMDDVEDTLEVFFSNDEGEDEITIGPYGVWTRVGKEFFIDGDLYDEYEVVKDIRANLCLIGVWR